MSYVLKNISVNRPLVFTLKDKETTLRLAPGEEKTIPGEQMTEYIHDLGGNEKLHVLSITEVVTVGKKDKEV